jgi:adenosylhomocysteine nucleosidase
MAVAVLSALQTELDLLIDSLAGSASEPIGDWPIWRGSLGNTEVIMARAGLGKVNTAALSALVWERHRPKVIVLTGVAGGLDPCLGVGDLVVGERSVQHDAGVMGRDGLERYQAGHVPFFNPTEELGFVPSHVLLETMRRVVPTVDLSPVLDREPEVVFGTIVTGDVFLQDVVTRDRLFAELSAQAIEMEGAALGQVASRLGVDHLVVRSISDLAGEEAVEHFDRFVAEVSANSARLLLALLSGLQEHDRDLPVGS